MIKIILAIALITFSSGTEARGRYTSHLSEEQCLSSAIYYEANAEPMAGKKAVMDVILNRAKKWEMTICQVVQQRKQFSFVSRQTKWLTQQRSEDILTNMDFVDSPFSENVLWFHATYVHPRWKLRRVGRIRGHIFYEPHTI